MSAPAYQIAKWQETFETSESRRYKTLTWVSLPIGCDSTGYLTLVEEFEEDSAQIYGAWCALLSVAAQAPTRGQLIDTRARPYTLSRIAKQTHMRIEIFERLFAWASREDVGWLEVMTPNNNQTVVEQQPNNNQTTDTQAAVELRNVTEPNLTKPTVRTVAVVRPIGGEEFEKLKPRCEALKAAVDPNPGRKLKPDDRELCVKAVLFEHAGLVDLSPLMLSMKRSKPDKGTRWGYFRGALKRSIEESGQDFHRLYQDTPTPPQPEPVGASP